MADPAFAGVGKKAGLELWRIEGLAPVKQAEVKGKFHEGDSYILLVTTLSKSGSLNWAIHFWLGSETSIDEAGVAAYKTVELDASLGGSVTQYREVQGSESSLFMSYFKGTGGIEYLPGGVASGFKHVEKDVYSTRLLLLKGKRTVRVSEVKLSNKSLNKGDVFILDAGLKIFIFNGATANKYEKAKGIEVASQINSDQRSGRAEIIILDDDIRNEEFWGPLGGFVDPLSLPEGESDDVEPKRVNPRLFCVSGEGKEVGFTEVALPGGKLEKSLLDGNDVFILLTSKIFIWVGSGSTMEEKKQAIPKTLEFMKSNGIPASTPIERVSDGNETAAFKAEFAVWSPPVSYQTTKASAKAAEVPIDVQALLARKAIEDTPVDDGSGNLKVWIIKDFAKVEVEPSKYGQFYGGDSYILLYTYKSGNKEEAIIYFWLGKDSSIDEQGSAAVLAKELDDSMGGKPVQIRVTQGKEPSHFCQLFKGKMVVHAGGHASGFSNSTETDSMNTSGVALYHVKGTTPLNTYGVEVKAVSASLNSEDSFVLVTPPVIYVWRGTDTNNDEVAVAANIANFLRTGSASSADVVTISEGTEPEDFWATLGGKGEYPRISPGVFGPRPPRLFSASTATGTFKLEEVDNFDQTDLNDDDVFLLDTFTQLFVWVGSQSTQEEKSKSLEFANRFVAEATDGRDPSIPIIIVQAGAEPPMFTAHFRAWDAELSKKRNFVDPYQARLQALAEEKAKSSSNAAASIKLKKVEKPAATTSAATPAPVAAPVAAETVTRERADTTTTYLPPSKTGFFTIDVLKHSSPEGVDPSRKEDYLDDASFASHIGVDRAAFAGQPKWKRDQKKKELGIF